MKSKTKTKINEEFLIKLRTFLHKIANCKVPIQHRIDYLEDEVIRIEWYTKNKKPSISKKDILCMNIVKIR